MKLTTRHLTKAEEAHLIRLGQAGDIDARNEVIMGIYALIWSYCIRIARRRQGVAQEYVHVAIECLCREFHRFDLSRGNRYGTYAMYWVKKCVRKHIQRHSWLVSIPYHFQRITTCNEQVKLPFQEQADRAKEPIRLSDSHAGQLVDHRRCADRSQQDHRLFLALSMRFLRPQEQEIVKLRLVGASLKVIGLRMGVTKERIRQIELSAFKKIKRNARKIDPAIVEEMECAA